MVRTFRVAVVAVVMTLAALALPGMAAAQAGQPVTLESFAGVWEGTAQTPERRRVAARDVQDRRTASSAE